MRKLYKALISVALCVALFVGSGRTPARAQGFPTIDLSNLLQNIIQYLQDADVAGIFSDFSDLEMKTEQFMKWKEQFDLFMNTYQKFSAGLRYAKSISSALSRCEREMTYLWSCSNWLASNGATPEILLASRICISDFTEFFVMLQEDTQTKTKFFENLKSGDAVEILKALDEMVRQYEQEFSLASTHYRMQMSNLYHRHMRMQTDVANMKFYANRLFY